MLTNVYKFSFSDCSLPSPNDGWTNRHLKDYIGIEIKIGDNFLTHDLSTTRDGSNIQKNFTKNLCT